MYVEQRTCSLGKLAFNEAGTVVQAFRSSHVSVHGPAPHPCLLLADPRGRFLVTGMYGPLNNVYVTPRLWPPVQLGCIGVVFVSKAEQPCKTYES